MQDESLCKTPPTAGFLIFGEQDDANCFASRRDFGLARYFLPYCVAHFLAQRCLAVTVYLIGFGRVSKPHRVYVFC